MESSLSHQIKVGIFATVGVAMFLISVVLLGGDRFFLKKTYELKVKLPQVQGLGRGSVVSLSGVPIGNVTDILFIPGSAFVEVHMNLEQAVQYRITEGSTAAVKTQGALGDKYIYIQPGPLEAKPLPAGAEIATDASPDFLDVIASKGSELGEVVEVIKEVRTLFHNMNADQRSAKIMSNLVTTTHNMNQFLGEAREVLGPLSSVMKKVDQGQGTLGALINDPTFYNRLMGLVGDSPRNKFLKPLLRDSIQTHEK